MRHYLTIFALLILISLSGCSFIKEKLGTKQPTTNYQQNQQQQNQQQKKENQQNIIIPTNPHHS